MTKFILINGVRREMTSTEETKFDQDVIDTKAVIDAKKTEEENAATKKASGKQKLLDLGLSEEEVKSLIGV
tara:strand:- start:27 stop:239 length:213 start_codon:yes stop_codon:yes gene_type:complete